MLAKRIEEASLNAWPALQHLLFDGWTMRFSKGFTKRANSVNPLFVSHLNTPEKVDRCERLYVERKLPARIPNPQSVGCRMVRPGESCIAAPRVEKPLDISTQVF
jgi:hypothetical protein